MTDGHEGVTHGLLSTLSVVYDRLSVVRSLCSFREKLSRYYLRRGSSSNFFLAIGVSRRIEIECFTEVSVGRWKSGTIIVSYLPICLALE